jgi:hypothetical protein
VQPVYGGPAYVFRNVLYNVVLEPFKMHSGPSGVLFYHNTIVKKGGASLLLTPQDSAELRLPEQSLRRIRRHLRVRHRERP